MKIIATQIPAAAHWLRRFAACALGLAFGLALPSGPLGR